MQASRRLLGSDAGERFLASLAFLIFRYNFPVEKTLPDI